MKKLILSTLTLVTILSISVIAAVYTLTPAGSNVSGSSSSLEQDGSYVGE